MTSQQFVTFLAVASTLNYRKAAEQLYISQPAVTKHIMAMEAELGFPLFKRTKRSVVFTPEGELFFNFAKKAQQEYDSVMGRIRQAKSGSQLCIACEMSFCSVPMMDAISEFMRLYPVQGIRYEYVDLADMYSAIEKQSYDIYLTHSQSLAAEAPFMDVLKVEDKRMGFLAKRGYMGIVAPPDSPSAFDGCDFIDPFCGRRPTNSNMRQTFFSVEDRMQMVHSLGLHPANFISMPNWQTVLSAVTLGMGVTLSAEGSTVEQPENCIWVPTNRVAPLVALWHKENDDPARVNFCRLLRERAQR